VDGPRADARRHGERLAGRQRSRIAADALGQYCGETDFLEHVQIVVRCRAIGPDAHGHPQFEHLANRRNP